MLENSRSGEHNMKIKQLCWLALLLALVVVTMTSETVYAQQRMTFEEYQMELKSYQDRENAARASADEERQLMERLRAEIRDLNDKIAATWADIYAVVGISEDQYNAFVKRCDDIENRIRGLERLSPERLLDRAKELDEISALITSMLGEKPAKIPSVLNRLDGLMARVERLKASLPRPQHDMYTVIRGDHLWRIAGKRDIYGDSWKWMRIYSANRVEIKDPDLIYPNQRLRIPRQIGRDEYLVKRGDNLSKIAGMSDVYGDPFKWTSIYQANKSGAFLSDANLIYPEMILSIPRN